MVIALIALFVAMGGSAYAALNLPANSVGTKQLKNGAVTSVKVKTGSLQASNFAAGQIPAGPTGPTGPSNAYARWNNGPIGLGGKILSLNIPQAGAYVLWAKATVGNGEGIAQVVTCRLAAQSDVDQTTTVTPSRTSFPATSTSAVIMTVAHVFSAPGVADLTCSGGTSAEWVKITAIRVGNLTNTGP